MAERLQMNLRLDGRQDLLEAIKGMAAAEGLSVNAWVVRTLESAIDAASAETEQTPKTSRATDIELVLDNMLDTKLDRLIADKLASFEERLGKLSAPARATMNRERQELKAANKQLAEWDAELNQLHERNGDLAGLIHSLKEV